LYRVGTRGTILWLFENILCGDIKNAIVENEICLLYWALSYTGHLNNTGIANESILRRSLAITHSFSVTSANIAIKDISLKTRFFGLHFCCRRYGSIFNHFDV